MVNQPYSRLASVGILGKGREPGVGKLSWHGNFDTGFERNISFKILCAAFLNFFWNSDCLLVYRILEYMSEHLVSGPFRLSSKFNSSYFGNTCKVSVKKDEPFFWYFWSKKARKADARYPPGIDLNPLSASVLCTKLYCTGKLTFLYAWTWKDPCSHFVTLCPPIIQKFDPSRHIKCYHSVEKVIKLWPNIPIHFK